MDGYSNAVSSFRAVHDGVRSVRVICGGSHNGVSPDIVGVSGTRHLKMRA